MLYGRTTRLVILVKNMYILYVSTRLVILTSNRLVILITTQLVILITIYIYIYGLKLYLLPDFQTNLLYQFTEINLGCART